MSKNKSQSTVTTTSTSLYISLICLFPVMFLISYLIFYMIDTMLLKLDVSFVDSFLNQKNASHIFMTYVFLPNLLFYFSVSNVLYRTLRCMLIKHKYNMLIFHALIDLKI